MEVKKRQAIGVFGVTFPNFVETKISRYLCVLVHISVIAFRLSMTTHSLLCWLVDFTFLAVEQQLPGRER